MNPGLLREPLVLERMGAGRDALGQPSGAWAQVAGSPVLRGWRRRAAAVPEAEISDRKVERERAVFRLRSQPFLGLYRPGDRLREPAGRMTPERVWEIRGTAGVEGTNGEFCDVEVEGGG